MSFFVTFCFLCFWLAVGNALADRIVMASSGVKGLGFLWVKGSSLRPTGSFWILVRRWLSGMSWCNGTFWTSSVLGLEKGRIAKLRNGFVWSVESARKSKIKLGYGINSVHTCYDFVGDWDVSVFFAVRVVEGEGLGGGTVGSFESGLQVYQSSGWEVWWVAGRSEATRAGCNSWPPRSRASPWGPRGLCSPPRVGSVKETSVSGTFIQTTLWKVFSMSFCNMTICFLT